MKASGIILLKDESTRFPGKNRSVVCNRRLYDYLFHTIRNCREYDAFYVLTFSQFFTEVAEDYGIRVIHEEGPTENHLRAEKLAKAAAQTNSDIVVEMTICHPFIKPESLDALVRALRDDDTLDSAYTAKMEQGFIWSGDEPVNFDPSVPYGGTQDAAPVWHEANHYAVRYRWLNSRKLHHGERRRRVEVSAIEALDVHYPEDLKILDAVYKSGVVDWV